MLILLRILFLASAFQAQGADRPQKGPEGSQPAAASPEVAPASLKVKVEGIGAYGGEIGVGLFKSKLGYPIHLEHVYEAEWTPVEAGKDSIDAVFDAIPAGDYAVSVLHDENGNRQVDRSAVGFPKEGVGFSNEQKVTLKAPGFDKSKFSLSPGENKGIVIRLDYRHRKAPAPRR